MTPPGADPDGDFAMQKAPFYSRQLQPGRDAATDSLGKERYQQCYEPRHTAYVRKGSPDSA